MPIVDGLTSTKMIRSYEKTHPSNILSSRAALNGRIPVFAVSASLVEKDREMYVEAGFDGWILKPVDFKRLAMLLGGIVEEKTREACLYKPGYWLEGGWFSEVQPTAFASSTSPSSEAMVSSSTISSYPIHTDDSSTDPISQEQNRLHQLSTDASHDQSMRHDPGESGNIEASGTQKFEKDS